MPRRPKNQIASRSSRPIDRDRLDHDQCDGWLATL
jgi:hypothetical protein